MNVNTVELRLYDRRFNDIPDLTINILCPGSMYGYLYIGSSFTTITRLKDMMLLSPCHFVKSRFHCNELTTLGECLMVVGRGSWVQSRGSWVVGTKSWVMGRGSWVVGRGYKVVGRAKTNDEQQSRT